MQPALKYNISYTNINRQSKQASNSNGNTLDLLSAINFLITLLSILSNNPPQPIRATKQVTSDTRHSLNSQLRLGKRNCMSSNDRDTSTPRQRNRRRQNREQRAQSELLAARGSPPTVRLEPLGGSSLVSPYPQHARRDISTRSQGDGISDHKETEEEEAPGDGVEETKKEEEEEGQVSDENTNNKTEDNSDDDQSHTSTQSSLSAIHTMSALTALVPFDLNLTHILTVTCQFQNNSTSIQAVQEYGITTFDEFRTMDYDHKWEYTVNNATQTINGLNAITLAAVIAWSRDLEAKNDANKELPQNWTNDDFMLWRRNEYIIWKKLGAAALVSSVTPNTTTTTGSTSTKDDRTRLNDFNKASKAEKDYEVLKNEEYFY